MGRIRIGILGCADIAKRMMIPSLQIMDEFELVAVASRTKEKAIEFAQNFRCEAVVGYEALLRRTDIQAVYIPLPVGLHYSWIREALLQGKHVIAEKSLAADLREAEELVGIADRKGLALFENFMFKYHSQIAFVKNKIQEGAIGEMRFFRSAFGFPPFKLDSNIRYKPELGGGALLDAGAYTVQSSLVFLGKKIGVLGAHLKIHDIFKVDWWGGALLSTPDGIISQIAFSFDNYYQNNIEIWGSTGRIFMERAFTSSPGYTPGIIMERQNYREEFRLPADNHFVNILRVFHRAIINNDFRLQYEEILNQSRLITSIKQYEKLR